jgi:hypothetical protein
VSARRTPRLLATALALTSVASFGAAAAVHAATITVVNADGAGEGFNDPTPVSPVAGNSGTTRGQQRLNAFQAAAAYWANRLHINVTITIHASMDPLLCTPTSAILGSAGPTDAFADFPHAPLATTWYTPALANTIAGSDQDPSNPDISAQFNSALDSSATCLGGVGWFYGIGVPTPAHGFSLYETVRHEIGHGLGFLTYTDVATGARLLGYDDVFETHLEDHSTGKRWPQMTNNERKASAIDPGDLHWVGTHVQAAASGLSVGTGAGGHVKMFAPATLVPGSSVSHWDTSLFPDEIMEPIATPSPNDIVTSAALQDIGWTLQQVLQPGPCTEDAVTACLQNGRFEAKVTFTSTGNPSSGNGQVMSFGGQRAETAETAFYWFFAPSNFEMGLKVLNGCGLNSKWWVFVSGLTDQGWSVNVRDTQSGVIKTYSNPLGHLSATYSDTSAFACP